MIACRLSVCLSDRLSATLVDCDHIGWNSSKIISRIVSLGCSLSVEPNIRGLLQWEHPEILAQNDPPPVDLSVGDIRSQIAAEWLQTTIALSKGAIADILRPPLPLEMGVPYAPKIREWPYHRNG